MVLAKVMLDVVKVTGFTSKSNCDDDSDVNSVDGDDDGDSD